MKPESGSGADEEVLAALSAARRRTEPAPSAVVEAAKAAFSWWSVVAAVAGLEFDSAVDDDDLVRVRDSGSERRLRFRGEDWVVEIVLIDNNRRLAGRIDPPLVGSVVMRHSDGGESSAPVNNLGQFYFDKLRRGAMSLQPLPADGTMVGFETEWVTI
jgi:hypothetical protein